MTATRISKQQFKTLLRECLAELIDEGAFDKKISQIVESRGLAPVDRPENENVAVSVLKGQTQSANPGGGGYQVPPNVNPALMAAVDRVASGMSSDNQSIFKNILIETAMTTLQKQLANEVGSGLGSGALGLLNTSGPATPESIQADKKQLQTLAGGDVSRWARTAFGKSPTKK